MSRRRNGIAVAEARGLHLHDLPRPPPSAGVQHRAPQRSDHAVRHLPALPLLRSQAARRRSAELNPAEVIVYIDGGARGNPGPAGYGVRVEQPDGTLVEEFSGSIGVATNNVAEVSRPDRRARMGEAHGYSRSTSTRIRSCSSSRCWATTRSSIRACSRCTRQARLRVVEIGSVTFEHVARANNAHADRLANAAMDDQQSTVDSPQSAAHPFTESGAGCPALHLSPFHRNRQRTGSRDDRARDRHRRSRRCRGAATTRRPARDRARARVRVHLDGASLLGRADARIRSTPAAAPTGRTAPGTRPAFCRSSAMAKRRRCAPTAANRPASVSRMPPSSATASSTSRCRRAASGRTSPTPERRSCSSGRKSTWTAGARSTACRAARAVALDRFVAAHRSLVRRPVE